MRFIFFTKTDWNEPARFRHQLARLLANVGHEVIFFQRPSYLGQLISKGDSGHPSIYLYRYRQLLHHKLRLHPWLHRLNAIFERDQIKKNLSVFCFRREDIIVNFNYDYFFLRGIFPSERLITIINDDFWSTALGGYVDPLKWALTGTIRSSDVVLTVSLPLQSELAQICPVDLFLPWSPSKYISPSLTSVRQTILYWGYINDRLDFDYIAELANGLTACDSNFNLLFVGPLQCRSASIRKITRCKNVHLLPAADLDDLNLSDVSIGLIPYRSDIKSIEVATLPNKALQLLARGIPLAITGMPNFIPAPFVFRLGHGTGADIASLQALQRQFSSLQPSIREFVEANGPDGRLKQFLAYI